LQEFAEECDSELQRRDTERRNEERLRREAYQIAQAEQAEKDKIQRVVNAKKAYEQAEKRRQETYEILRQGDVSMFGLDFRITSNSPTDEVARLMSQLGRTTVIVSPGSWGSAFHTSENCEWLIKGRNRASKFSYLGDLISIEVEDAIYQYKKRPCHSCFMFWWEGGINPNPEFGEGDSNTSEGIEIFLGDPVTLNQGAFEDFEAEVIDLLRGDKSHVKVLTHSLGREIELIVPVDYLDYPENIDAIRQDRAAQEQRKLEESFRIENERLRTLEELILRLENGLKTMVQNDLKSLLIETENRLENLGITGTNSLSMEYLQERLDKRIQEAKRQTVGT
jgi:transcription antitermination factor NusG